MTLEPGAPASVVSYLRDLNANQMFCWSEASAVHVGIIQSRLTTCRLQAVDPCTYLVDVLQRIGRHPASDTVALTPRVWKERFAHQPLRSNIESHGH